MREITDEVKKVIIGKDEVVDMVFAAIFGAGSCAYGGRPGRGKNYSCGGVFKGFGA